MIKARYASAPTGTLSLAMRSNDRLQEQMVANATAEDAKVRAVIARTADGVKRRAISNVKTLGTATQVPKKEARRLTRLVAERIAVKPVLTFRRDSNPRNSLIPVALVVANGKLAEKFEYGSGNPYAPRRRSSRVNNPNYSMHHFPMTRFMGRAARAAASAKVVFYGRGAR